MHLLARPSQKIPQSKQKASNGTFLGSCSPSKKKKKNKNKIKIQPNKMLVFSTKIFSRNKYTSQTRSGKNFFRKLKSPTRPRPSNLLQHWKKRTSYMGINFDLIMGLIYKKCYFILPGLQSICL